MVFLANWESNSQNTRLMIPRAIEDQIVDALRVVPVVTLVGSRQVGKTTLALKITADKAGKPVTYLDLERDSDLAKLNEPEAFLQRFDKQLLIIDEVQKKPDLFGALRSLIDSRRRAGEKGGHFLLLGSASRALLQHSSETLAGRIRYLELTPLSLMETRRPGCLDSASDIKKLWLRGGFPGSYLAETDTESWNWLSDFIVSYVERDLPSMGPRISATRMKRFWTMLAHCHGQQVNLSSLGNSLGVNHKTIRSYLDTMTDFYMVRQLPPWAGNTRKRLVKSPKAYLRDTGILHSLLNVPDYETLLGHPVLGASWKGFALENIIAGLADKWQCSYYRTLAKTEIDLVLEGPKRETWAIEVKHSTVPEVGKGYHLACSELGATRKLVIYPGDDRFPLGNDTEALGLDLFLSELS